MNALELVVFVIGQVTEGAGGAAPGAAPPAADAPLLPGGQLDSVWDYIIKGGPAMAAIIVVSFAALAVVIERSILLRRRVVIPPDFLTGIEPLLSDRDRALAYA